MIQQRKNLIHCFPAWRQRIAETVALLASADGGRARRRRTEKPRRLSSTVLTRGEGFRLKSDAPGHPHAPARWGAWTIGSRTLLEPGVAGSRLEILQCDEWSRLRRPARRVGCRRAGLGDSYRREAPMVSTSSRPARQGGPR